MFNDVIVEHGRSNTDPPSPQLQPRMVNNLNVCWNEKTTQTDDVSASVSAGSVRPGSSPTPLTAPGETSSIVLSPNPSPSLHNRKASLKRRPSSHNSPSGGSERVPTYLAPGPGPGGSSNNNNAAAGLTCQELLALSGALGAALPTPLALPSPYVDELPSAGGGAATTSSATTEKHNNNNQLVPPGIMPILPSLAMSLWPEPFQGKDTPSFHS